MAMNLEQVLAASKNRKTVDVQIEREGWESVRLQELSTAEMMAYRRETKGGDEEEAGLQLLARCWVDDAGERLFAGADALQGLGCVPIDVLQSLTKAVLQVNGLNEQAVEEAGND